MTAPLSAVVKKEKYPWENVAISKKRSLFVISNMQKNTRKRLLNAVVHVAPEPPAVLILLRQELLELQPPRRCPTATKIKLS
jgi:hypothetical protein